MAGTLIGRKRVLRDPDSYVAGYVSVWYQGEEAHITEIAVRAPLRGNGIGELLLIGAPARGGGIRLLRK